MFVEFGIQAGDVLGKWKSDIFVSFETSTFQPLFSPMMSRSLASGDGGAASVWVDAGGDAGVQPQSTARAIRAASLMQHPLFRRGHDPKTKPAAGRPAAGID